MSPLLAAHKAAEGPSLAFLKLLCGESLPLSLSQTCDIRTFHLQQAQRGNLLPAPDSF